MRLTICFVTSRVKPCLDWFLDSLRLQLRPKDEIEIGVLVISPHASDDVWFRNVITHPELTRGLGVRFYIPKPTVYQGPHRLTKSDMWAASNARNTALCLAPDGWIAFLDDRCVLMPGYLDGIRRAMKAGYAVCGSYEKRVGMTVEKGVIRHGGTITGEDHRLCLYQKEQALYGVKGAVTCPGEWLFGCNFALPVEWMLQINGQDETCDGMGMEDVIFGLQLKNAGFPLCYDPNMKMIEDRTPSESHGAAISISKGEDKGKSPNDKSHALLAMLRDCKAAQHQWDLRTIRRDVQDGKPFPIPTKPDRDWYDSQPLKEMPNN